LKEVTFSPVNTASLSKQIADQIRQSIMEGNLRVNDQLPTESELSERFGVSRPTIREALKRLAAQNLIRSKRGPTGGTFVQAPDIDEACQSLASQSTLLMGLNVFSLDEVMQTRLELESLCARLAAMNRTDDDLAILKRILTQQAEPDVDAESLCRLDVEFHRAIAQASKNKMLSYLMHGVIEALQPAINLAAFRFRSHEVIYHQHQMILSCIERQSSQACAEAMENQINYIKDRLEEAQKP
jgi:GntR family transcriptional repressor for pyruvate dehydrogenase complex